MNPEQSLLRGAILVLGAEFLFASMAAAVKAVSDGLPSEMVVFGRNVIGLLLLLPWVLRRRGAGLRTSVPHLHLLRALLGVSAMYCFFYALARLPLAEGLLLKMTAPLFLPVIGWLWLREQAPALTWAAIPIGFAGVLVILRPAGDFNEAALVGLAGGLLAAGAKNSVRALGHSEPAARTVFYFGLFATLVSAVPLAWRWQAPTANEWLLLATVGALGVAGQLLMTRAYATASPSRIGPFTYFSVIFGAILGFLLWAETVDLQFGAGATLVILAGLMALRRKRAPRTVGQKPISP